MNWLKNYLQDFPTHPATVATGLTLFFLTGIVVLVRLALSMDFPQGYDNWIWALLAAIGVSTIGGIGKRATDINLALAKKGIVSTPPAQAAPEPAPKTDGS